MARFQLICIAILVAAVATNGPARAQPRDPLAPNPQFEPRSKLLIPSPEGVEDFRPYLAGKVPKPDPKGLDLKVLKDLMDKLNKMPKDEQPDKAQIEKMLKDNPAFKDPAFLNQLEKMLQDPNFPKNLEGKLPKGVPPPDQEQGEALKDKIGEVIKSGKEKGDLPEMPKKGDMPKAGPDAPDPTKVPDSAPKNPYEDNEWVQWMQKSFGDSPAAQEAIKDLVSSLQQGDLKGAFDDMPDFKNGGWKDLQDWGKSNGVDFGKIKPPDMSTGKGGSSGAGNTSSYGGGGGGSVGVGGAGLGLGGGGTALLVIAGTAAALFLALLLFRRWKDVQATRAALGVHGSAGIDFDAVRSREELVRAFNHVSLDQMGEEARSWNHRVIAGQIAETKPAQAAPATELAGLYERARYAPTDEDLSAGEFADARRDLRTIAGVPA